MTMKFKITWKSLSILQGGLRLHCMILCLQFSCFSQNLSSYLWEFMAEPLCAVWHTCTLKLSCFFTRFPQQICHVSLILGLLKLISEKAMSRTSPSYATYPLGAHWMDKTMEYSKAKASYQKTLTSHKFRHIFTSVLQSNATFPQAFLRIFPLASSCILHLHRDSESSPSINR